MIIGVIGLAAAKPLDEHGHHLDVKDEEIVPELSWERRMIHNTHGEGSIYTGVDALGLKKEYADLFAPRQPHLSSRQVHHVFKRPNRPNGRPEQPSLHLSRSLCMLKWSKWWNK